MVDKECVALMANLHSKASVGNLMVVYKKYFHLKLLRVAKAFPCCFYMFSSFKDLS
jgi:hypothetical protein